jgi:hypothetical protein
MLARLNLIDLALAVLLLGLIPISYGSYLLFRVPLPTLTRVEPAVVERQSELRLQVHGSSLEPYMRVSLGEHQAVQFLFRDATFAEAVFSNVPPGQYDVVLRDVAQERSRLPNGLTITSATTPGAHMHVAGFMTGITDDVLAGLTAGSRLGGSVEILKVGTVSPDMARVTVGDRALEIPVAGTKKVELLLKMPCEIETRDTVVGVCVPGESAGSFPSARLSTGVYLTFPVHKGSLPFLITHLQPPVEPASIDVVLKVAPAEVAGPLARVGDVDVGRYQNQLVPGGVITRPIQGNREISLRLPAFASSNGWDYLGQPVRVGAPLIFMTPRYQISGVITAVSGPARVSTP